MAAISPDPLQRGFPAPDFTLVGVDGRRWSLAELRGPRGLVVAFICNHCPFVKAVIGRLVRDARDLKPLGVNTVAICSNDAAAYPEDDFTHMVAFARDHGFDFPYLHDVSQDVARAYGAVCTPDLFGFNAELQLQYRGQIDASRRDPAPPGSRRDLFEAMTQVASSGIGPEHQVAAIGCSIKWKD